MLPVSPTLLKTIRDYAIRESEDAKLKALMNAIGDSHFVLIGEATHGTHEFYRFRAELTKRLIREKGFCAVAVEADWPDAYRANRFAKGDGSDATAESALGDFRRFPTWMWRNEVVVDFLEWLEEHNNPHLNSTKVGFYGLDLYSLFSSMNHVVEYLRSVDSEAARKARFRYGCFDHVTDSSEEYGYSTRFGLARSCENEVVAQLMELQERSLKYLGRLTLAEEEALFSAEQNARLARNAEEYYRTMFRGDVSSWNLRDAHMVEMLTHLTHFLARKNPHPKVVVWAHNSHLGDASATQMGARGEWNIGSLLRKVHGKEAFLVGFTTYSGTVTAASDWGEPAEKKHVRKALSNSYESLFHETNLGDFLLILREEGRLTQMLREPRLERAIGVVYLPQTERASHYFEARLSDQFDAVVHVDETNAVTPLETTQQWQVGEPPETYPSAL